MIKTLVYLSAATRLTDTAEIARILTASRRNNARDGITGLLIYHDGSFFQTLEGPPEMVENCFDRIGTDHRHTGIIRVFEDNSTTRFFAGWQMGYRRPEELPEDCRSDVIALRRLMPELRAGTEQCPIAERLAANFLRSFREYAFPVV